MSNVSRERVRAIALVASLSAVLLTAVATATGAAASPPRTAPPASFRVPPHIAGVVPSNGVHPARSASPDVDNLVYNNGPVMSSKEVSYAIFWLPPTLQDGSPTYMSPTYQPLIERYFDDVGGHRLYAIAKQYYQIVGGQQIDIRNRSWAGPAWVDTSPYPPSGCDDPATPRNCLSDLQIKIEVGHAADVNGWKPDIKRMFFVFTSYGEGSCFGAGPSGCAFTDYCAYHGDFLHKGHTTIYANMPYLGTTGGCHTPTSPNNDIAADSTINVASHEQMESVTDPLPGSGWTSPEGEIGDKCVWFFGSLGYDGIANQRWNGNLYVLQEEWSNRVSQCTQGA